jgi:uncharacterized membrane protein YphA (DoxX/SURF4 family)
MDALKESRLASPYWALRTTFVLVPLLAGMDKFTNLLTNWPSYLSHSFARLIPLAPSTFMHLVGVVEIVAAVLVLWKTTTRIGAYVVGAWLVCIAINLLSAGMFDVAVRDLAMAVGAYALARLEEVRVAGEVGVPVRVRPREAV